MGNDAIVLCKVESAFWRELVCLGRDVVDNTGMADEDLVTVFLLLGVCWVIFQKLVSGSSWKSRTASRFRLPSSAFGETALVDLDEVLPSAGCTDFTALWEAFIQLKPHIYKVET